MTESKINIKEKISTKIADNTIDIDNIIVFI